jgi:cobalt-zinc-cadmium efflux system membrane fusion protein
LREKGLYEDKISSKEDFLKAQSAFKKADAQYIAAQDSINFEVRRNLLEATRAQRMREIELKAAEQSLYIFGLTPEDVKALSALAKNQGPQAKEEEECTDPNCTECAAKSGAEDQVLGVTDLCITNEKLAWYPIRSPFDGTIIDKHITLGEVVSEAAEVFIVADLSTVWVDLHVYQKDLMKIKKGQKVIISAGQTMPDAEGVISYVGPVVGAESRTALARVVLPNTTGIFRPGLFVTAKAAVDDVEADVIVPKSAVQTFGGNKCVFIKDEHGFEFSFINLGQSNAEYVEVTSGLNAGQRYVTKGAFELKAKIATGTLDSHAGHGH